MMNTSAVVRRYQIDEHTVEVNEADAQEMRKSLIKPWDEDAVYELAAAKKLALYLREKPIEEQWQHFWKTVEDIRAAAAADGTMIDTEEEAAIGD